MSLRRKFTSHAPASPLLPCGANLVRRVCSLPFLSVALFTATAWLPAQQPGAAPAVARAGVGAGSTFGVNSPSRSAAPIPAQRVILADLSDSPSPHDGERWLDASQRRVFDKTQFGDSVIVYGVHDHTAESAPIFDASVPLLPPDASMDETMRIRRALRHARVDGKAALDAALRAPIRSHSTRLIEALRRIPKDPDRATELIYLSDMLESTPALNMERTRITSANVAALVQTAIDSYRLTQGMLDGVTVYCVLDSPSIGGAARRANDHQSLELFWRLLASSLGGNLASFDSRVQ